MKAKVKIPLFILSIFIFFSSVVYASSSEPILYDNDNEIKALEAELEAELRKEYVPGEYNEELGRYIGDVKVKVLTHEESQQYIKGKLNLNGVSGCDHDMRITTYEVLSWDSTYHYKTTYLKYVCRLCSYTVEDSDPISDTSTYHSFTSSGDYHHGSSHTYLFDCKTSWCGASKETTRACSGPPCPTPYVVRPIVE